MKKFLILLITVLAFSGCGQGADTNVEDNSVAVESPDKVFTNGDFSLYAKTGVPILTLGMAKADAETRQKQFIAETGQFATSYMDKVTVSKTEDAKIEPLLNYIGYDGPNTPIYTSKGIYTTGLYGNNENCSLPEEIISAYNIDVDNENYITNQKDDKNFCINLFYNGEDRIVVDKATDINSIEAQKLLRFYIADGVVRNIELFQYNWE